MNELAEAKAKTYESEQKETREAMSACLEVLDRLSNPYSGVHAVVRGLVAYYGVRVKNE